MLPEIFWLKSQLKKKERRGGRKSIECKRRDQKIKLVEEVKKNI